VPPQQQVQLGHAGAPNLAAQLRYAVFFRPYHEHHDPNALDILADIWREFPSLQLPPRS
jgi:hypothetical protein